jgi:hypothetical protein
VAPVILLEVIFVASNFPKILESGWLPLAAGFLVYYIMAVWNKGRLVMKQKMSEGEGTDDFENFLDSVEDRFVAGKFARVKGTAVYMTGSTKSVPMALAHNLKHNRALHDHIIVVTLKVDEDRAIVPMADRVSWRADPDAAVPVGGESALSRPTVEMHLRDGRVLSRKANGVPGDPRHPIAQSQLEAKFRDCVSFAAKTVPAERIERAIALINDLENMTDAAEIVRVLA